MEKEKIELARDIIFHCRQKIQSKFPFLSIALYFLRPELDDDIKTIATEGYYLYYNSDYIIRQYRENKNILYLGIIHTLLHCLLRHFSKKQCTYYELYDVTMDVTVYMMLFELGFITSKSKNQMLKSMPELQDFLKNKRFKGSIALYNEALNNDKLGNQLLDNASIFELDNHTPMK